ncbi:MAG: tRNA 4-thiouridine(8) synthase ThiI [Candidatus Omnitrophota bacterium]
MDKKAIALISGGLDSLLAARLVMDQGVEVVGAAFVMQFASRDAEQFKTRTALAADEAGIPIIFKDISTEFLRVLKNPKYGYGANLNPCIDCRILMLESAKKILREERAGFIVTGEVLGERPMSQMRGALEMIEKKTALEGLLLRPLSAKLFKETFAEKQGIVDRDKLLSIEGRSREVQLRLAKKFGLSKFFAPGGGCLLTDEIFSRKLRDLMAVGAMTKGDIDLLKHGRHFRLDKKTKIIVGRDNSDNEKIQSLKEKNDVILRLENDPSPYVLIRGEITAEKIETAAKFVISHSKSRNKDKVAVEYWKDEKRKSILATKPMQLSEVNEKRIG